MRKRLFPVSFSLPLTSLPSGVPLSPYRPFFLPHPFFHSLLKWCVYPSRAFRAQPHGLHPLFRRVTAVATAAVVVVVVTAVVAATEVVAATVAVEVEASVEEAAVDGAEEAEATA